jgi:pilus assembly protein Flp/PilA
MKALLVRLWKDDAGQDMVEYALIAGLISIVAFGAVQTSGQSISTIWNNVSTDLGNAA